MGVKKVAKKTTMKPKGVKSVVSAASSLGAKILGGGGAKRTSGMRRNRQTPEKLAKKLLMLKLQKKIYKVKYGGR